MNQLRLADLGLGGAIILVLAIMLIPLPTFLMDVFLAMNILGGLVILFVALYTRRPLDFAVFPSLLLVITLFRLALNVATTRLILGEGYAGEIIQGFGSFVVSGNYVVGFIIFIILVIINFMVITKGATRIAEVTARFTLDAMPGKQMAIDADLNAGILDEKEARQRRKDISAEADFYGAMDGAAKFVRGDAIAGLLITGINIVGGLIIGTMQLGMSLGDAAMKYTLLTVGDGLVAQIPSLVVSTAAGLIVTRSTSESDLGRDVVSQIGEQPRALWIASGAILLIGFIPAMPFFPFGLMSFLLAMGANKATKSLDAAAAKLAEAEEAEAEAQVPEERIEAFLHPDPFEIEIGYGLISLVDTNQGGDLLGRISSIRKSIALELGMVIPPIRLRDNINLGANEYLFKVHGIVVSRGEVMLGYNLVLNPDPDSGLVGIETEEPTFKLPALWVADEQKAVAESMGYTVVDPQVVVATHLMEVLKSNAYKLLDRQEVRKMLDDLKEEKAAVVEGLVPDLVPLGVVQQTLRNLLREGIPIRNLVTILETIADHAHLTKDADVFTEYVRSALSDAITDMFRRGDEPISVTILDPRLEDHIMQVTKQGETYQGNLGLTPGQVRDVLTSLSDQVEKIVRTGSKPALLVSPAIRRSVRVFTETVLPNVAVLSFSELSSSVELKSVGSVSYPDAG
ncbi:MAG: flagellar biosynthesis protein FlhA [Candidatus Marinimicrobia bacterium]|nr:flagellar biosynthesis protein FlhA [Candidatus Neomarinimicrobiota bacterium]